MHFHTKLFIEYYNSIIFDCTRRTELILFHLSVLSEGHSRSAIMLQILLLTIVALTNLVDASSEISFAEIDKCTTIIVGKTAGAEGPMTTHTADCSDCDFRLSKVTKENFHHFIN
jgi:hypothetical protein